jgi:hypothetical protein
LPAHVPWFTAVIRQILDADDAIASGPLPAPEANNAVAVMLRMMLALTSAICLASAITGVGAMHTVKEGEQFVTQYVTYGAFPRMLVAALGVAAAVAFVALFRRTTFVWKCALVAMPLYAAPAAYWGNVAFFAVFIGLMTAWLAVLWYTQKDNFVRRSSNTPPPALTAVDGGYRGS